MTTGLTKRKHEPRQRTAPVADLPDAKHGDMDGWTRAGKAFAMMWRAARG